MNKKVPPIYKDRDFEYIDIVLMFDEATKRLERSNSSKAVFKIALLSGVIQALLTIGIIFYYENYSQKSNYEVVGEKFYKAFEALSDKDQIEVISLLKQKSP